MKTKEFIKRVEELGYTIFSTNEPFIEIYDHRERILAVVSREEQYQFNSISGEHITKTLFDLIVEYTSTPPEDREEEKKFLIQHKYLVSKAICQVNLAKNKKKMFIDLLIAKMIILFIRHNLLLMKLKKLKKNLIQI